MSTGLVNIPDNIKVEITINQRDLMMLGVVLGVSIMLSVVGGIMLSRV